MASVALYVCPNTTDPADVQRARLEAWAIAEGHAVAAVYVEPERKRGADPRRRMTELWRDAPNGAFSVLGCISLPVLARSLGHANETLTLLSSLGIAVVTLDGINTATDGGATARAFALCAGFDRELCRERAAKSFSKRREAGLHIGRPRLPPTTDARIVALLRAGVTPERITRMVGVGKSTVYRVKDELRAADTAAQEAAA